MAEKLKISIPNPCQENWYMMSQTEKGKFCSSCQKTVYDFTKATDREIERIYKKNKNLCGRFLSTQLNRELEIPKKRKSLWLATSFLGALTFYDIKSQSQDKPIIVQTIKKQPFKSIQKTKIHFGLKELSVMNMALYLAQLFTLKALL